MIGHEVLRWQSISSRTGFVESNKRIGSPVRLRTSDPLVNRSPVKSFVFNKDIFLQALRKALHDSRYHVPAWQISCVRIACILQLHTKMRGYARQLSSGLRRGMHL